MIKRVAFLLGAFTSASLVVLMAASVYSRKFHFWPPSEKNWKWEVYWSLATGNMASVTALILTGLTSASLSINAVISVIMIFSGLIISLKAIKQLGLKQTSGLEGEFHSEGLYRFSRNPQVLGNLVSLFGFVSLLRTFESILIGLVTGFWLISMVFSEEKWLIQKYGDSYRDYRREVPRFF